MIKRLRTKIVIIITAILALAVLIIMFLINSIVQFRSNQQIIQRLETIATADGRQIKMNADHFGSNQAENNAFSFYVKLDRYNTLLELGYNSKAIIDNDVIIGFAEAALETEKRTGYLDDYAFLISDKPYGTIIVFSDASSILQQNSNLTVITSLIGVGAIIIFYIIAMVLSFWLVKPVSETFEKQKLFISNASHELKTPLAVISTNADVLEAEIGENKWLTYIKEDASRMSELVNELLSLARLDDKSGHPMVMSDFCISDTVLQTALPFESTMFEMGKKYDVDVEPELMYHGDESAIRHILTILIDNAIKYSDEKGEISIKLYAQRDKRIIEVYNTGKGIPEDKLEKVFERFYREDEARNSKSGGYGLGLSIAREIVRRHKGSISAKGTYGRDITFTVVL